MTTKIDFGNVVYNVHWCVWGEERGVYRVLVEKPAGNRPLGRLRRRWEDNIKIDLQEVGCWGMDWVELLRIGTGCGHL